MSLAIFILRSIRKAFRVCENTKFNFEKEENNVVPDVTYIFDLSNVSPGIYFAQLLTNEGVVQTEKFVKF